MGSVYPILWANFLNWRRQYRAFLLSGIVKPLFYLIIFNLGMGRRVNLPGGIDYLHFMIPGLLTMSIINHSFNEMVNWITVRRNHFKVVEFYLLSPNSIWSFLAGNIFYGMITSLFGFFLLWIVISFFSVKIMLSVGFFLVIASLSVIFTSLAVVVACVARNEGDSSIVSNLIMTPLTFLCGTFFPLERLPLFLQYAAWCTPVTPGVYALRALALGQPVAWPIMAAVCCWTVATFLVAGYLLGKEEM